MSSFGITSSWHLPFLLPLNQMSVFYVAETLHTRIKSLKWGIKLAYKFGAQRNDLTLDRFESPSPRASDSAFLFGGAESAMFPIDSSPRLLVMVVEVYRVNDKKHNAKERTDASVVHVSGTLLCSFTSPSGTHFSLLH